MKVHGLNAVGVKDKWQKAKDDSETQGWLELSKRLTTEGDDLFLVTLSSTGCLFVDTFCNGDIIVRYEYNGRIPTPQRLNKYVLLERRN